MNAGTSNRRNSRLTSELLTLNKFENHVTELMYVRCRNSRRMPELPTVGTLNLRRNSRPSRLLKIAVGFWSGIPDTFGMTRTVNPPSQLKCETSELLTLARTPDEPTREQQFYHCWVNTGHIRYCQTNKNKVSSFVAQILKTHMGWLEHL